MKDHHAARAFVYEGVQKHAPISISDLSKLIDMSPDAINWHMTNLRTMGLVYVIAYVKSAGRTPKRVWAVGDEIDARRPAKFGSSDYFDEDEIEDEFTDTYLDSKRRQKLLAQIKPFRDPLVFMTAGRAP